MVDEETVSRFIRLFAEINQTVPDTDAQQNSGSFI
jgi:hypothetical protein